LNYEKQILDLKTQLREKASVSHEIELNQSKLEFENNHYEQKERSFMQ